MGSSSLLQNTELATDQDAILKSIERHKAKQAKANSRGASAGKTASRLSVARPEDIRFIGAPRQKKKSLSLALPSTRKEKKQLQQKLIKVGWLFCLFLMLKLVFMQKGVLEFFSQESQLNQMRSELSFYQNSNQALKEEMKKIRYDFSYQKELIREKLGYIAKDEVLILFASDA